MAGVVRKNHSNYLRHRQAYNEDSWTTGELPLGKVTSKCIYNCVPNRQLAGRGVYERNREIIKSLFFNAQILENIYDSRLS